MAEVSSLDHPDATHVITIDGPSGAGKGTVAMLLAKELGYHLLDSGAVYRAAALQVIKNAVEPADEAAVTLCVEKIDASFDTINGEVQVLLDGEDVTASLRNEQTAGMASAIAVIPGVRVALHDVLRSFRRAPGLVADGRDMGTVVFPDAWLKVFLTASAEERAIRRHKQLNQKGVNATLESLLQEIQRRDERDSSRSVAPMIPAVDALIIDSTGINATSVVEQLRQVIADKKSSP